MSFANHKSTFIFTRGHFGLGRREGVSRMSFDSRCSVWARASVDDVTQQSIYWQQIKKPQIRILLKDMDLNVLPCR